jgi:transposase
MIYIGMDTSIKSFEVYAINDRKKVVFRDEIPATRSALRLTVRGLGEEPKLVVFEAGNQLKWIASTLKKLRGVHVHVVHPNVVKWISQSSGKTDKIDARKLAQLARGDLLPKKVHIVEGKVRQLRELLSARSKLQSKRVALINTIRGYMLQEGYKLPKKFFDRRDWKEQLNKSKVGQTTKLIIASFMTSIEALLESERQLSKELLKIEDDRLDKLESIPSIGGITSRTLLSAIDDAKRFDDKKAAAKYGALTPRIFQSGEMVHLGRINQDGRHGVRRVLLQCAHTVARMKTLAAKPLQEFFFRIMKRRGKKIAIVALARKLMTIAYAVLKTGEYYDPAKLVSQPR